MIGAGDQTGQNDAANLLKPALARGKNSRTIASQRPGRNTRNTSEGRGPGAPLPGSQSRGAKRAAVPHHDARPCSLVGEAPQRAHPR